MARRYCGQLIVNISLRQTDGVDNYRCNISLWGRNLCTQTVLPAPADAAKLALDCPEMFDEAAHAALSFAYDEQATSDEIDRWAAWESDGCGWFVTRKQADQPYMPDGNEQEDK